MTQSVMLRNLIRYRGEEKRLIKFAEEKLIIKDKELDLKVFLLEKEEDSNDYMCNVLLAL